ncbi:unnamed protein product [Bursaphelenchus okinawaensis]|uniref:C3H1-type domain-containing protein n=1 Tax=Bursaphelenchus okinawaensis TaxID=465554 RepID=A0A811KDX4_9BILA|nr:unnamed protein product [Bursaphelenchus okinawaensis]CAG9101807.1 unnamed protein product [Bursaphelenchus okinawaensis]
MLTSCEFGFGVEADCYSRQGFRRSPGFPKMVEKSQGFFDLDTLNIDFDYLSSPPAAANIAECSLACEQRSIKKTLEEWGWLELLKIDTGANGEEPEGSRRIDTGANVEEPEAVVEKERPCSSKASDETSDSDEWHEVRSRRSRSSTSSETDSSSTEGKNYKTMMCLSYLNKGYCKRKHCTFAHGKKELRKTENSAKYHTKVCINFQQTGRCQYGKACTFIHRK